MWHILPKWECSSLIAKIITGFPHPPFFWGNYWCMRLDWPNQIIATDIYLLICIKKNSNAIDMWWLINFWLSTLIVMWWLITFWLSTVIVMWWPFGCLHCFQQIGHLQHKNLCCVLATWNHKHVHLLIRVFGSHPVGSTLFEHIGCLQHTNCIHV